MASAMGRAAGKENPDAGATACVTLLQGVDCHTQAALPDGSLVDLGAIFRGNQQPAEFGFEYRG